MEGAGVEECDADEEVESEEAGVSVDDVLRVLNHGDDHVSSRLNRFQTNHRSTDELKEVEYNSSAPKTKDPSNLISPHFIWTILMKNIHKYKAFLFKMARWQKYLICVCVCVSHS